MEEEEARKAVSCHEKECLSNKPVAGAGSGSNAAEPGMRRVIKDQIIEAGMLRH